MEQSRLRHINPFLYVHEHPLKYRVVGIVGFTATVLAGIGFANYLSLSVWYWIIFGPITFLLFFGSLTRNVLRVFYPRFSKKEHLEFVHIFWIRNQVQPSVDVFLPWCGEDLAIYEQTLRAAKNLEYSNLQIYILDDKGDDRVMQLANAYNFHYLSRPNKGQYKKSGNLQYGYDQSYGEFVFVLDADFLTVPNALWHLIPYIATDKNIGILQTPQYFEQTHQKHTENPIEFGGGNIVEEFYSMDQVCRDRFDAAICVGTSAVYRRAAIYAAGGTPKVDGTEDVRMGLSITTAGYRVKYLPLILTIGTSPDTIQGYFRQHNRWCAGSLAILFDYWIKARIGIIGRMIYLLNPVYYISQALIPILVFHYIALIAFHPNTIALYNSLLFIPKILFELFVMPVVFRNHRMRLGTKLAAMNNIFTYFYTIFFDMPFSKKRVHWHPAGVAIDGISKDFRRAMRIGILLTSTYIISLTYVLTRRWEYIINPQMLMVLLWCLYIASWYLLYIYHATGFLKTHDLQYRHPTNHFYSRLRHARAHIKHWITPLLVTVLFATVMYNLYTLMMINM